MDTTCICIHLETSKQPGATFVRACIGMVGMAGWFIITQLPLGDATVLILLLNFHSATCTLLKEILSWSQVALLALSVAV